MTSKAEWLALAERCEKGTGPDREIDWCIHAAILNWPAEVKPRQPGDAEYTASLDAITALIERELPEALYCVRLLWDAEGKAALGAVSVYVGEHPERYVGPQHTGVAATPALALCAAFCRAMAEAAE